MYDILFAALYGVVLASIIASMIVVLVLMVRLHRKHRAHRMLMVHAAEMDGEIERVKQRQARAAAHFEQYREWVRGLLDTLPELFLACEIDDDGCPGVFTEANSAICTYLCMSKADLLKKTLLDIQEVEIGINLGFTQGEKAAAQQRQVKTRVVKNMVSRALKMGHLSYEARFCKGDGTRAPVLVEMIPHPFNSKPMLVITARDLNEARREQKAREDSERRLRDFFLHSPLGIVTYDAQRRLTTINRACLSMFGMPDQREFEAFNLFESPFLSDDARGRIAKGEVGTFDVTVNFDEAKERALFVSRRTGRRYYRVYLGHLGHDAEFVPLGYFAQIEDVTERRTLETELRRFQMAASESGADAISGSLKNVGFSDMIQILCAGGQRMQVAIRRGETRAVVHVGDGNIVHCAVDGIEGDEAFYHLMSWRDGDFTATPCDAFTTQTITTSAMGLLMEGARRQDEGA